MDKHIKFRAVLSPGESNLFVIQKRTIFGWRRIGHTFGADKAQSYLNTLANPQILIPASSANPT